MRSSRMATESVQTGGTGHPQNQERSGNGGTGAGRVIVVGIGPGSLEDMTPRARTAIETAQVVAGYDTYIELIQPLLAGKPIIGTGMMQEVERCQAAVDEAKAGKVVAVVSSGDPGVYGGCPRHRLRL